MDFSQFQVTLNELFVALKAQDFVTCVDPLVTVGSEDALDCRIIDEP